MKESLKKVLPAPELDESPTILHKGAICYIHSLKKAFNGFTNSHHLQVQQQTVQQENMPAYPIISRTSALHPDQKRLLRGKIYIVDYYIEGTE